ncbi:phage Gp37/Gp68 family protein [Streptomyces sp. NPDC058657]|uniref:phage Gp37/Gp68 family protein n=1 Tax=unclassified Streptomyces TaxID=2593676 RepID=UPI0036565C6F
MAKTNIEWTRGDDGSAGVTWNPITGCDRVSPGCDNCYALTMAKRLKGMGSAKYQTDGNPETSGPGFGITSHAAAIREPLRWKNPRRVFVNSMGDLFHAGIHEADLHLVFGVMAATPQHTYQVLTKRHGRMRSLLNNPTFAHMTYHRAAMVFGLPETAPRPWPLPNVWLGVSVEDQHWADIRIPALLNTPAAVRFLSCEPLLGPVRLNRNHAHCPTHDFTGGFCTGPCPDLVRPNWVICGGESGRNARPAALDWFRTLRDDCAAANIPYFFKQHGEYRGFLTHAEGPRPADLYVNTETGEALPEAQVPDTGSWSGVWRLGKKQAGRTLDGREWSDFPVTAEAPCG